MSKNLLHSHFLTAKFTKLWGLIAQDCWLYASFSTLIYARYLAWPCMAHIIVFSCNLLPFFLEGPMLQRRQKQSLFHLNYCKSEPKYQNDQILMHQLVWFFYVEWENQVKSICKKIFRRFFRLLWLIVNFSEKTICS